MKYIDLTHTFTDNMPVYPGDPPSSLKKTATIEKDTYTDHQINSFMHVGTHMDAPLHMIKEGKTMDQIEPEHFFGPGVLIDARKSKVIDADLVEGVDIPEGAIVLLYTGFARKYRTPAYYEEYHSVSPDFAKKMVENKVKIVGMDILGPDLDTTWPAHKILLSNDVLIIENLTNLDQLLDVKSYDVVALPVKFKTDAAFVRVVATVND